ncbi:MAG: molecular chaperone DnaJ [Candidatus Hydrogenedentes bacterium]|jgi:molecular chaperone DnaJ|nr:molecular chaperone DnaJ [Candidatus Hydrogenedentota bacterium]
MPGQTDLYEILGVSKNASQDEVRKAYLKLAHKYHPDKTGGDKEAEKKLKEINAAYDILKNPEKRQQYDRFGSMDGQPFGGGGADYGGFGGFGGSDSPFGDLFDMLFSQGRGRSRANQARPGADLVYDLSMTLEEILQAQKKKISFARQENCGECRGTGASKGTQPESCPQCHGTGQIRQSHGVFSMSRSCPRCSGTGRIITNPCQACRGEGFVKSRRELEVSIPAGVDDGMRLRMSGEGEAGQFGGPRGDLYIRIHVAAHDFFEREDMNVYCEVPVSFTQAALGGTIRVPTLSGQADLKVPAGTQTGMQLRLRGHGIPDMRGYRRGDQFVIIRVETPAKLSKQQRKLLEELEKTSTEQTYPKRDGFIQKTSTSRKN